MRKPEFAIELNNVPFDKYVDGGGFIHATGREIVFSDGPSTFEYEDCVYDVETMYTEDEYYGLSEI